MANFPLADAWASSPARIALAVLVTLGFAALARAVRGVSRSGTLAGGLASFVLFAGAGPAAFFALAALFALTWASTRLGYRRKQELGVAEGREGRTARQVLANVGVAAISALLLSATGNRVWLVAMAAALAEAAADTVASEIGQTQGRQALLITTWKPVPAGTDGGVTLPGTMAGAAAGLVIAAVCVLGGLLSPARLWIPAAAGFAGMLIDSVLGATCERRGWMNNEIVNFLSTLAAAALAYGIANAVHSLAPS